MKIHASNPQSAIRNPNRRVGESASGWIGETVRLPSRHLAASSYLRLVLLLLLSTVDSQLSTAFAQGTAFTYQGRLNEGTNPAGGIYDFRFAIYDGVSTGTQQGSLITNSATAVSNSLFTVTLDFGNQFPGAARWLEIAVRTNSGGAFSTLTPRQPLTATPYAIRALSVGTNGLAAGTYANAVALNNPGNSFTGNGTGVSNVNAVTLNGLTSAGFWKTNGNSGANPTNGAYLGTSDNLPLELKVNGQRALRLEPNPTSPNVIGGSPGNLASNGIVAAFIGGGGNAGFPNRVGGSYAVVPGGAGNTASGPASMAMGLYNSASGYASLAIGQESSASGPYSKALGFSAIASGEHAAAIGYFNTASGFAATALGSETAATNSDSTAMGRLTLAGGSASTALGYRAKALHHGSFIWADQQEADFNSTGTNQFLLRASGGVGINTNNPDGAALAVNGNVTVAGQFKGGYAGNVISNGVVGGFIGGGGGAAGIQNRVGASYASVLGGAGNIASADYATAMGYRTTASGLGSIAMGYVTLASGLHSTAIGWGTTARGEYSTAMGFGTVASGDYSSVMGLGTAATNINSTAMGYYTLAGGFASTAMGHLTTANGLASTSMGSQTAAMNDYSTAMGYRARALHDGSFVWADQQEADFNSTGTNQFAIRATGGFFLDGKLGIGLSSPGYSLDVQSAQAVGRFTTTNSVNGAVLILNNASASSTYLGAINFETNGSTVGQIGYLATDQMNFRVGGQERMTLDATGLTVNGVFVSSSDRNAKEDFAAVDAQDVLAKVAALPLQSWSYTNRPGVKHVGPMAQDFRAAFGLGEDDKHIATVDADGVALAAIQGLNQKLEEQRAENAELKRRLAKLEKLIHAQKSN